MIDPRELLAALSATQPVSGAELARRFGVTRAAVWKQIESLRRDGAPIDAEAGSGYVLATAFEFLDREAILCAVPADLRPRLGRFDLHWRIDSTNSELLRRIQAGETGNALCLSEIQSAGRGRRGRRWQAPLGGALMLSLAHRFETGVSGLAGLSLATGIAVAEALESFGIEGIGLKWPNDIQHAARKLGGILIEIGGDAQGPSYAVIGIGLNVRLGAWLHDIDQAAIDLAGITPALPPRNALAGRLVAHLLAMLESFEREGFSAFAARYARYDVLQGRALDLSGGQGPRMGIGAGVDARGALRVRTAEGECSVDSGEVSVHVSDGPGA